MKLGRLSVEQVATFGYPRWGLTFMRPSKHYGLICTVDVPWTHYEIRWT